MPSSLTVESDPARLSPGRKRSNDNSSCSIAQRLASVEGEIDSLREENESLRREVVRLLLFRRDGQTNDIINAREVREVIASSCHSLPSDGKAAAEKRRRNKKMKRRNGRDDAATLAKHDVFTGSKLVTFCAFLMFVAMLVKIALGQGAIGRASPSIRKRAGRSTQVLDEELLGDEGEGSSYPQRLTQAETPSPTTTISREETIFAPVLLVSALSPVASNTNDADNAVPSLMPSDVTESSVQPSKDSTAAAPDLATAYACAANPESCGCRNSRQTDYRGSISTTRDGHACKRWDQTEHYKPEDRPDSGLEENFCRNPDGEYEKDVAWCFTEDPDAGYRDEGWAYCAVPLCGCPGDADPETCGCHGLFQSDYRGSIDKTASGRTCQRWDSQLPHAHSRTPERYPGTGLEGNSFCRNPDNDGGGAWCYTTDPEIRYEYCNIPTCGDDTMLDSSSAITGPSPPPTASPEPTSQPSSRCELADKELCGCKVLKQADYRGSINTTADGNVCRRWDVIFSIETGFWTLEEMEEHDLQGNFCRNPDSDERAHCNLEEGEVFEWSYCDVPMCDPCSCMPPCGSRNLESCGCPSYFQAESCCDASDASCRCGYLKEACQKSLENGGTEFCSDAELECCSNDLDDPVCKCSMYEQICSCFPGQNTCEFAAESCCGKYVEAEYHGSITAAPCLCDFFTYTTNNLLYRSQYKPGNCTEVSAYEAQKRDVEHLNLLSLYDHTGGKYWLKSSGWKPSIPKCQWYGISCDDDGFVTEINLSSNNLTGAIPKLQLMARLKKVDLSRNNLLGFMKDASFWGLRQLSHVDLSENNLTGAMNVLAFPAAKHLDCSHNNFTSIAKYTKFNPAYLGIRVIDLSNNLIEQDVREIFHDIPPNLEGLILSNNAIGGTFPDQFPILANMRRLVMDGNSLGGPLPDFPSLLPQLRQLILSNQAEIGGFTGSIPAGLSKLRSLAVLNLAKNKLSQSIPAVIGLSELRTFNLSSNMLGGTIPKELGRLEGVLEVLDLSSNKFAGQIPLEIGSLKNTLISLRGNDDLKVPAPLKLCFISEFDFTNDTVFCPTERNALKDFYDSAKGGEWTKSDWWLDPYESHCNWTGVTCNDEQRTINLTLHHNALSGTLSTRIADLSSLQHLDLSDNDMKGSIPETIGRLSNLAELRLSYNAFTGQMPVSLSNLTNLARVQLHSNMISGTIPTLVSDFSEDSSFVSDCGVPTMFDDPLKCIQCTMCCNLRGDCELKKKTPLQKVNAEGFEDYANFTWVYFVLIVLFLGVLAIISFIYQKRRSHNSRSRRRVTAINRDQMFALDSIGEDSVYQFFLSTNYWGWAFALLIVASQIGMLFLFARASEVEFEEDRSDFVYSWKCPRNKAECKDTSDVDWQGWLSFAVLMAAHLLKDIINGAKLVILSGNRHSHSGQRRIRFFVSGILLSCVSMFTLYTSTIYNFAIATSNTDMIINSVIILFVTDIDEYFYTVLMAINPAWVEKGMIFHNLQQGNQQAGRGNAAAKDEANDETLKQLKSQNSEMQNKLRSVESEMEELSAKLAQLQERMETKGAPVPSHPPLFTDEWAENGSD